MKVYLQILIYKWHGRVSWKQLTLHSLFAGIPLESLVLVMQTFFREKRHNTVTSQRIR
jgi:hypothetical protein